MFDYTGIRSLRFDGRKKDAGPLPELEIQVASSQHSDLAQVGRGQTPRGQHRYCGHLGTSESLLRGRSGNKVDFSSMIYSI